MKNKTKTIMLLLVLTVALLSPLCTNAQEGGLFGLGNKATEQNDNYGMMGRGTTGSGITLQNFGENQNNLTLQNFGEEAPLGSGWLILMGAGLGYAALKQRKTTKSKQNK